MSPNQYCGLNTLKIINGQTYNIQVTKIFDYTYFRYKDDYSFQENSKRNSICNSKLQNNKQQVKQVEIYLNQDDGFIPQPKTKRKQQTSYFTLQTDRFNKKSNINLKYFTSELNELPGPITPNMEKMLSPRKDEGIRPRYNNNLRKVLYQSSYQRVSCKVFI